MRLRTLLFVVVSASCWGKSLSIPKEVIEEVKTTLLPMFGITETPKLDGVQVHVPEVLKKLYDIQNDLDYDTASLPITGIDTGSANTVRSFIHIESPVDQKFTRSNRFRLKFNVSTIPPTEILKAAEVKLTRAVVEDPVENHPYQRILMHDILRPGVKGVRAPITRVIDSKMIDTRKNSTVSLDVYPAVKRWMEVPKHNHGVLVTVTTAGDKKTPAKPHLRLRRESDPSNWARSQPLLLTYTDDGKNKQRSAEDMSKMRRKRGTKRQQRKNERDPCRRRQMYVNFRDVGWSDWIVAPLGYDAFYCGGECDYPMPDHMNTTNHAIVQSLINSADPSKVPKPCCVPTQLSSMSMLYVGSDNNVILKNYKEMVVVGCGCR